jgi:5'(3')-deoxyribonucleotidase
MIILFDLDNTVYDLLGGLEKRFKGYKREYQKTYSFSKTKGVVAQDVYALFGDPNFFYELKPFPHVIDAIERLRNYGHYVRFFSSCMNEAVAGAKAQRLWEDLPFEPELCCYLGDGYPNIHHHILVDDNPIKIRGILERNPSSRIIITKHNYNQGIKGQGVLYIDPFSPSYVDELLASVLVFKTRMMI